MTLVTLRGDSRIIWRCEKFCDCFAIDEPCRLAIGLARSMGGAPFVYVVFGLGDLRRG